MVASCRVQPRWAHLRSLRTGGSARWVRVATGRDGSRPGGGGCDGESSEVWITTGVRPSSHTHPPPLRGGWGGCRVRARCYATRWLWDLRPFPSCSPTMGHEWTPGGSLAGRAPPRGMNVSAAPPGGTNLAVGDHVGWCAIWWVPVDTWCWCLRQSGGVWCRRACCVFRRQPSFLACR